MQTTKKNLSAIEEIELKIKKLQIEKEKLHNDIELDMNSLAYPLSQLAVELFYEGENSISNRTVHVSGILNFDFCLYELDVDEFLDFYPNVNKATDCCLKSVNIFNVFTNFEILKNRLVGDEKFILPIIEEVISQSLRDSELVEPIEYRLNKFQEYIDFKKELKEKIQTFFISITETCNKNNIDLKKSNLCGYIVANLSGE